MPKGTENPSVICPFYVAHQNKTLSLVCEQIEKGHSVKQHFENKALLKKWMEQHCEGNYQTCPFALVIANYKYDGF